jgi:hypothetical protein
VLAFRQLVLAGQMNTNLCRQRLADAKEHLAAILTYLALTTWARDDQQRALVQETVAAAQASPQLRKLRFVALGAFAAGLFSSKSPDALADTKRVLEALRHRTKLFGPEAENDRYLGLIFEEMGVPR